METKLDKYVKNSFTWSQLMQVHHFQLDLFTDKRKASIWYRGSFKLMEGELSSIIAEYLYRRAIIIDELVEHSLSNLIHETITAMNLQSNFQLLLDFDDQKFEEKAAKAKSAEDRRKTITNINFNVIKSSSSSSLSSSSSSSSYSYSSYSSSSLLLNSFSASTPLRPAINNNTNNSISTNNTINDYLAQLKTDIISIYQLRIKSKLVDDLRKLFRVILNSVRSLSINAPNDIYKKGLSIQERSYDVAELWFMICKESFLPHPLLLPAHIPVNFSSSSELYLRKQEILKAFTNDKLEPGESLMDFALRLQWYQHAFNQVNLLFDNGTVSAQFYASIQNNSRYVFAWNKAELHLINFHNLDILKIVEHMEKTLNLHTNGKPYYVLPSSTANNTDNNSIVLVANSFDRNRQNHQHSSSSSTNHNTNNSNNRFRDNNNKCFSCGEQGHRRNDCTHRFDQCILCNQKGHIVNACNNLDACKKFIADMKNNNKTNNDNDNNNNNNNNNKSNINNRLQNNRQRALLAANSTGDSNDKYNSDFNETESQIDNDSSTFAEQYYNDYFNNDSEKIQYSGAVFAESDFNFSLFANDI